MYCFANLPWPVQRPQQAGVGFGGMTCEMPHDKFDWSHMAQIAQ